MTVLRVLATPVSGGGRQSLSTALAEAGGLMSAHRRLSGDPPWTRWHQRAGFADISSVGRDIIFKGKFNGTRSVKGRELEGKG